MSAANYLDTIEKCYIAYYGREADVEGAAFWATKLEEANGNLDGIIDAFATSPEAEALYGGRAIEDKIDAIYNQLFGRDADEGGLKFYCDALTAGTISHGAAALSILDGAQAEDLVIIQEKVQDAIELIDMNVFNQMTNNDYNPDPTPDPDPTPVDPSQLSGTYKLVDFKIDYEYGLDIDSDMMPLTGTLEISDGSGSQNLYMGGFPTSSSADLRVIDGDTMIATKSSGQDYEIEYHLDGNLLTTIAEQSSYGVSSVEYDYWEYVGS